MPYSFEDKTRQIEGLRKEAARFPDNKETIEIEIARIEKHGPTVAQHPDDNGQEPRVDRVGNYITSLRKELKEASGDSERTQAIKAEIARAEAGFQTPPIERAVASRKGVQKAVKENDAE